MNDDNRKQILNKNIQILSYALLAAFIGLMSYMVWFQVFMAEGIEAKTGNIRYIAKTNEVLRGTIFDRNGAVLSFSERTENGGQKRVYNGGAPMGHPLGYVSSRFGVTELESRMQAHLTKDNFSLEFLGKDFLDMLRNPTENVNREKFGDNVVTTLDQTLQKVAFDRLGNQKGVVVAMDPSTGEILAMVSTPTYDPTKVDENFEAYKNSADGMLVNFANVGLYPPGSTMKVVTLASALQNINNATGKIYKDEGKITFADGRTLPNLDGRAYGNISLERALIVSSNVVYGTVAMEVGNAALRKTAEDFGFNERFSFHDINLEASKFPTLNASQGGEIAQTGIGQGEVLASPMLMAMVTSAIANDGEMMQPRLVSSILSHEGVTKETFPAKVLRQSLSKEDSDIIASYMKKVVDGSTSANLKDMQRYSVAGKTGSAQYSEVVNGKSESGVHSWFIGFAPYENPEIAIAVIVKGGGSGSGAAADVAERVFRSYLGN
jgi:cell division protein FtsI/penicillin-binding protein 2